jgi:hypothetical protein
MHFLVGSQGPPKVPLHDEPVLENYAPFMDHANITMSRDVPPPLVEVTLLSGMVMAVDKA